VEDDLTLPGDLTGGTADIATDLGADLAMDTALPDPSADLALDTGLPDPGGDIALDTAPADMMLDAGAGELGDRKSVV